MKNFEIAKEDIKKAGLKIKTLHTVVDNELLPNTVLGIAFENEEISPGTPLNPGDSVDIYISNIDTTLFNQDSLDLY